jgi:hypothetical protein
MMPNGIVPPSSPFKSVILSFSEREIVIPEFKLYATFALRMVKVPRGNQNVPNSVN